MGNGLFQSGAQRRDRQTGHLGLQIVSIYMKLDEISTEGV